MKYFWIAALIAIVNVVLMLVGPGVLSCGGITIGPFAAIVTLLAGLQCVRAYRRSHSQSDARGHITRSQVFVTCLLSVAITMTYILLVPSVLSIARIHGVSSVTKGNLSGIWQMLHQYVEQYHNYPPELDVLVELGFVTPDQLKSPLDPDGNREHMLDNGHYSSFTYRSGSGDWRTDGELVVAYERDCWTPIDLRLLPRYGRYVLYADGHVDRLDDEAFQVALREDAALREKIGWPVSKVED